MKIQSLIDSSPESWNYKIDHISAGSARGITLETEDGIYWGDLLEVVEDTNELLMRGNLHGQIAIGPVTSEEESNSISLNLAEGSVTMKGTWSLPMPQ